MAVHHSTTSELPTPTSGAGDRVSIYIWRTGTIDNVTSGHRTTGAMTRREWVLLVSDDPGSDFHITSEPYSGRAAAAIVRPGHLHKVQVHGCTAVRLTIGLIHTRFSALMKRAGPGVEVLSRERFAAADEMLRVAADGQPSLDTHALSQRLLDVVLEGCPAPAPLDPRVLRTLRKLARDMDHPFEALAAEVDMSLSRLSHLVTDQFGVSLRHYQAWLRMAYAWQYIVWSPQMSFTEIAHTLKFSDSSHLARAFRSSYGAPPSLFRDVRGAEVLVSAPRDNDTILARRP